MPRNRPSPRLLSLRRLPASAGALVLSFFAVGQAMAIGMRHDVPESQYLALAQNQPPYLPGAAPDFAPVAAIGLPGDSGFEVLGTGVLISPQWVLTAAHVVLVPTGNPQDFQPRLTVRFGTGVKKPSHERQVIDITTPIPITELRALQGKGDRYSDADVVHAEFHDLALLSLDGPVEGITPAICDDTPIDLLNYFICIAGYGDAAKGNNPLQRWWREPNLKRAAENVIDRVITLDPATKKPEGGILVFDFDNGQENRNSLNGKTSVWTSLFGEGTSNPIPRKLEGAPYPGDSGGPAFAFLQEKWRVVGISGYGTGFPLERKHALITYGDILVYANVKTHATWIKQVTGVKGERPRAPAARPVPPPGKPSPR